MNLRPVIKPTNNKNYLNSWIIEKFPTNYTEMNYLDPMTGAGDIFLSKEKSMEEVINDNDVKIVNIWRALRDENKNLLTRIKRIKCNKETILKHQKENKKDYLCEALSEIFLRQLSSGGLKKKFPLKSGKISIADYSNNIIEKIKTLEERLKDTFILNMNPLRLIESFDNEKTFVYADIPSMKNLEKMNANEHVELSEIFNNFRGKIMIKSHNNATYKRLYKNWTRKSLPKQKNESIWINF